MRNSRKVFLSPILFLALITALLVSCSGQSTSPKAEKIAAETNRLAGIWVLQSRMVDGVFTPANESIMELVFRSDGTFRANFRGEETQPWIKAGEGGFSYDPPLLSLHWDAGNVVTLLVSELSPDRLQVHQGRTLVPEAGKQPDEIFVRKKVDKGPTRKAS
jgi:hypothetical protein